MQIFCVMFGFSTTKIRYGVIALWDCVGLPAYFVQ